MVVPTATVIVIGDYTAAAAQGSNPRDTAIWEISNHRHLDRFLLLRRASAP
jgi:hypothetical protein